MQSLLPIARQPPDRSRPSLRSRPRKRGLVIVLVLAALFYLLQVASHHTLIRDIGYLTRPLWDAPEKPFSVVSQYAPPGPDQALRTRAAREAYCELHGWRARSESERVRLVDAVLFSSELDLLEIRMREYAGLVDAFVVLEADRTFSGESKPALFEQHRGRFDEIVGRGNVTHEVVRDLRAKEDGIRKGSFENEVVMRQRMSEILSELVNGDKAARSATHLIIETDVDEIISRTTLRLLRTCDVPPALHLNTRNYRYSFEFPLADDGYWRPKAITVPPGARDALYSHGRAGDTLLDGAGWHCSWCFPRLDDFRLKMAGYSHNDRLTSEALLGEARLRRTICAGEEPFAMWPEAFSFRDLVAQSGRPRKAHSFTGVPLAVQEDPARFRYLLADGCQHVT